MSVTPEEYAAMQAKIAELQGLVETLQRADTTPAPPLPNSAVSVPPSKTLKVAPPDYFDGALAKTSSFLSQLMLFLHGKRADVQSDMDKIILALSYMKGGTAGHWAEIKVRELADGPQQSWEDFLVEFKQLFSDPNPGATARTKMDHLTQGSLTADEYVVKFKELKHDTGYNDIALVEKFEKGLNSVLVDKIYALPDMPVSLEGWISWATKLDRQWRKREANKKSLPSSSSSARAKPPTTPNSSPLQPNIPTPPLKTFNRSPDVVPMEVDSGRKSRQVICYKCRKTGHIARDCKDSFNINHLTYEDLKEHFSNSANNEEKKDF